MLASAALVLPWRWLPPPTSAFMLRERLAGRTLYQRWVPYPAISRNLVLCVIAAEDQKFAAHNGFDVDAIARAAQEKRRAAARREHDLAAAREESVPVAGPQLRAQGARGLLHGLARADVAEAPDPRGVPERRRVRARDLRRRGRERA